jgi:transcriptional regulator with XRE-family HTH domain
MERNSLGQRLKHAREQRGLFQDKVAELLGVTSGKIISNWETGIARPNAESMKKLCQILGVSAAYMLGYYDNEKEAVDDSELELIKKYRRLDEHGRTMVNGALNIEYERIVPPIEIKDTAEEPDYRKNKFRRIAYYDSAASAGTGQYMDNIKSNPIKIPLNDITKSADYVIPIAGDSMEPYFSDHDRICVKYQTSVEIGEVGVFILNGNSYVKEYAGDRLVSFNTAYKDIVINDYDNFVCRGKVLGKI